MRSHYQHFLKSQENPLIDYKIPTYTVLMPPVLPKMLEKITEIIDASPQRGKQNSNTSRTYFKRENALKNRLVTSDNISYKSICEGANNL